MAVVGKLLIAVGALLLVHAGYYSVQFLIAVIDVEIDEFYVKLTETVDAPMPPPEVVIELGIAFVLSLAGVLLTSGELLPIRSNDAMQSRALASMVSSPDFYVFNHRGAALHKRMMS